MLNKMINCYECTLCQARHYDGELVYQEHIHRQSKRGILQEPSLASQNEEQKAPEVFLQDMIGLMQPKPADHYRRLIPAAGVEVDLELSQSQAAVILRIHDYGIEGLTKQELEYLYQLAGNLKDQIWP